MKKIASSAILIFCIAGLFYCNPASKGNKTNAQPGEDNGRNSLDWDGIYRGVLPCADCEGIQTTIYLNKDLSYTLKTKYLGKPDTARKYSGKFSWNDQGNTITLDNSENSGQAASYFVGENTLTQLDVNGKKITGESASKYILSKGNYAILEKYWKLTELYGKPVIVDSTYQKEPHIIFKDDGNRFIGNGGCNNISGSYELKNPNRVSISQAISTQMACPHMDIETQFLKALQAADSYTIVADMLVLNKARMAPLARFKTVYMK